MPSDPTLYVLAPTRTDASQAPDGYDKLENIDLTDLRENILFVEILTSFDIQEMYYSNKASIYGIVLDRNKNLGLKIPKKSRAFNNLYFVVEV